jgi:DNA-binding transcriptional regulator YhcF (GntR family)
MLKLEFLHSPFRICRDLVFYDEGKTETGKFFLNCRELGLQLGVSHKTASEYLNKLEEYEIIEVLSKGRMIGCQATEFKWLR